MFGLSLGLRAARESSAQPTTKPSVIGLLDAGERLEWWAAFRQQLRELGYVEGQSVAFEARFAGGKFEQSRRRSNWSSISNRRERSE